MITVINQNQFGKTYTLHTDTVRKLKLVTDDKQKNLLGVPVYIGRGTLLGNPFTVQMYGRENAIEMYQEWLRKQYKAQNNVYQELMKLAKMAKKEGLVLICHCKPESCHGDVVKRAIEGVLHGGRV